MKQSLPFSIESRSMPKLRLVFSFLLACASPAAAQSAPQPRPDVGRKLFELVNRERGSRGIAQLRWSNELAKSALAHGRLVVEHQSLDHQFPGEAGLMQRIAEAGAHFNAVAENLAFADSAEEIHSGLMGSPGHRHNILNPDYNALGVAVLQSGDRLYAVQNFARLTSKIPYTLAEKIFAERFNQLRQRSGLIAAHIEPDTQVRAAVCSMAEDDRLSAGALPRNDGVHGMVAFTASEPTEIPERLKPALSAPSLGVVRIGACYRETPHYPGGIYWFGVVY